MIEDLRRTDGQGLGRNIRPDKDPRPDELAFAFCFDVLTSVGSMTLQDMHGLLGPWGWAQDSILSRLESLRAEGLLVISDFERPRRRPIVTISVTPEGEKISQARGLHTRSRLSAPESQMRFPNPGCEAALGGERPHTRTQELEAG